jgi:hypothetical protein
MTVQELGQIAGVILSLAVAYIPGIRERFDALDGPGKARVMAALLLVAAVGVFGYGCVNTLVPCTVAGAKELFGVLVAALVANQATFLLFVKPYQK